MFKVLNCFIFVEKYGKIKRIKEVKENVKMDEEKILIIVKGEDKTKDISWSWIWVLSPIWITTILLIIIFAIIMIGGRIKKGKW